MIAVPNSDCRSHKIVKPNPARLRTPSGRRMDSLDQVLQALIREILALPRGSKPWQQKRQRFVMTVQNSGKLWRGGASPASSQTWREVDEHYFTALGMTWEYVLTHLDTYDPQRASVTTWINNRLRWDILTVQGKAREAQMRQMFDYSNDEDGVPLIDQLSASEDAMANLAAVCKILYEAKNEAQAIHVTDRPEINCYELAQDKLGVSCEPAHWLQRRDRDSYRLMAEHYDSRIPTIAGFWTNKCLPFLNDLFGD